MDSQAPHTRMLDKRQSLEDVYQSWTPLLLSALRRLWRSGYALDPAEGMDLIHDFFAEVVPDLLKRYEPERAQFSTYLYGAFLHFARPRIVRELRWKGMLTDLDRLPAAWTPVSDPTSVDPAESLAQDKLVDAIESQFALLPPSLRAVVDARILQGLSEREAAKRLKVSRYSLRQRTSEALGRLAVAVGEDHRIHSEYRPLALRVWRDGRSLMQAAGELGLSRAKARAAYRRLLDSVVIAATRTQERDTQERQVMVTNVCTIWARVIANPSDTDAVAAARANLTLLLDHVQDCEACGAAAIDDPERVFGALADGAVVLSPEEASAIEALHDAWDSSERDIETAMSQILLPALPPDLANLALRGANVTPLSAFLALSAFDHLVYRHLAVLRQETVTVTASDGAFVDGALTIPRQAFVAEIARHAEVPVPSADSLFAWALEVTRYVPRVFLHFVAVKAPDLKDSVHLTLGEAKLQHNLAERWAPHAPPRDEEAVPAEVAMLLRQNQVAAEMLALQLDSTASTAAHEDMRTALRQTAESNKREAAAIEKVLRSARGEEEAVAVLRAAADAEQCKQEIYQKVENIIRDSDLEESDIGRVVAQGQADSQSRVEKVEKAFKTMVAGGKAGR